MNCTLIHQCTNAHDLSLQDKHFVLQGYDVDKLNTFVQHKLQKVAKDFQKTDSIKTALQKSGRHASGTNTQGNNSTRKKTKPAWMLKKPSDEDVCNNKAKMVNGKEYLWCIHHKCYGHHKICDFVGELQSTNCVMMALLGHE